MTAREWSLSALLERVAELETALQPFAKIAPAFAGRPGELRLLSTVTGDVTVNDLRYAKLTRDGAE